MTRSSVHSRRISSTASSSRPSRSEKPGHSIAVAGTSFTDSPVPTPTKTRPGARFSIVAKACASTDGWKRIVGVDDARADAGRAVVVAASAPSHGRAAGACPPVCRNGWKWSETATLSNPASSARRAYPSSSEAGNCSADALYPISSIGGESS